MPPEAAEALTPRWTTLRYHPEQYRCWNSTVRFRILPCGRRSGKTELAKRDLTSEAIDCELGDGRFIFCAPTRDQAKEIYWHDAKKLVPRDLILPGTRGINESTLTIRLVNGSRIEVRSLDRPERIEGSPIDYIVIDEFADTKPEAWEQSIRPGLFTEGRPPGRAWILGVPRGGLGGHFATFIAGKRGLEDWDIFKWKSADILPASEIEAAKRDLDPLTYRQEYEADFVLFGGRAYYPFDRDIHARERVLYDPNSPLGFLFDFNVRPGVACVLQNMPYRGSNPRVAQVGFCGVVGEVWIPDNSTTESVCRKLIADWGSHKGNVWICGDSSGGARHTSQDRNLGSDWDQIRNLIGGHFSGRMHDLVPRANPSERARVNAVNGRLMTADGMIHLLVDPENAPRTVQDLEGVLLLEGGSGEIDKKKTPKLTHLSDALGYGMIELFPPEGKGVTVEYWE